MVITPSLQFFKIQLLKYYNPTLKKICCPKKIFFPSPFQIPHAKNKLLSITVADCIGDGSKLSEPDYLIARFPLLMASSLLPNNKLLVTCVSF